MSAPDLPTGTLSYRVTRLENEFERRMAGVEAQVRRLMWAIVAGSITLATSSVVFALTVLVLRETP